MSIPNMKQYISSLLICCLLVPQLYGQISGASNMSTSSSTEGTSLGANETLSANGIALGNRVKLRGYVDFVYSYHDKDGNNDEAEFSTVGDLDFLFDLSPVTAEVHLAMNPNPDAGESEVSLEQAFGRYSFNQDFGLSFGRQLTNLGYEADEAPGLYAVTNAYAFSTSFSGSTLTPRRNYVDGVRANFNNGQFGFSFGLHDDYFGVQNDLNDHFAIDIAASLMIIPGLEAQLGYAHQDIENSSDDDDVSHFNAWLAFNPGDLTLALEYDMFDFFGHDLWDIMLLANYQFVDWFGATLRYSHEDFDPSVGTDSDVDRFTLALLFSLTQHLSLNVEYSHADMDSDDLDEFYIEGLLTF